LGKPDKIDLADKMLSPITDNIVQVKILSLQHIHQRIGGVKMNIKMLVVFLLIISGTLSCGKQKENADNYNYKSIGTITGPDLRLCPSPCCSGWYIKIDSLTYEFDTLPVNSNIDLGKETFPLVVKLDWQLSNTIECPNKRITIEKIAEE
jgi:hypothetical protein